MTEPVIKYWEDHVAARARWFKADHALARAKHEMADAQKQLDQTRTELDNCARRIASDRLDATGYYDDPEGCTCLYKNGVLDDHDPDCPAVVSES